MDRFVEITGCNTDQAAFYIAAAGGVVDQAIVMYYGVQMPHDVLGSCARQPTTTPRCESVSYAAIQAELLFHSLLTWLQISRQTRPGHTRAQRGMRLRGRQRTQA